MRPDHGVEPTGRRADRPADGLPGALEVQVLGPGESPIPGVPVGRIGPRIDRLIDDMFALMRRARYVALSGPVVGVPLRVVTIDLSSSGNSQIALIDPVLEEVSVERQRDLEGCLSLPDLMVGVERHLWVTVRAVTRDSQPIRLRAGGILARILQHHIDHLDGKGTLKRSGRSEVAGDLMIPL